MRRQDRMTFWKFVRKAGPDECWLWRAGTSATGHGRYAAEGKIWWAHRLALESVLGELPPASSACQVLHLCENASCCNPKHLKLGEQAENVKMSGASGALSRPGASNGNAKLSEAQAKAIKVDARSPQKLARLYNVSARQIRNIQNDKQWRFL